MKNKNEIHITMTTTRLEMEMRKAKVTTQKEYESYLKKTMSINDDTDDFKLIIKDKK